MGEYGRRPSLKIELDIWDWTNGSLSQTLDITNDVLNYRFQKSIKTPAGSCQIAILPQRADTHMLDVISPMDVVRITEFEQLKFVGYVKRISYSGSIGKEGNPNREATITADQFGGLLKEASVGYAFGQAFHADFKTAAARFNRDLLNAMGDGLSYAEVVNALAVGFKTYLQGIDAENFLTYLETYLDVETGLTSEVSPATPKQLDIINGVEEAVRFWDLAEMIAEKPFNELWIDNGKRTVNIDGNAVTIGEKCTMVLRETPFDGTTTGVATRFSDMDEVYIDKDHLVRFDLARSMEEVYTYYAVKESAFQLSEIARLLTGQYALDTARAGRYLYRPFVSELFFARFEKRTETGTDTSTGKIETYGKQKAETLKAWFENNDSYLSGAITMMVPTDSDKDPKIGEKIRVYGLDGWFYVEGIAHQWQYQGALVSNLTVTRGWNRTGRIEVKDRIFRRSPSR